MPKCFTDWTVLPHKPIEKVGDNLWRVSGMMGKVQRQMVAAKLKDGRLIIHNAIALEEPAMAELEAWGEPAVMFIPNAFHRQDAAIWKKRYPKIQVIAPVAGKKRISKIVAVDGVTEDAPSDDSVKLRALPGAPHEGVLEVRSGGGELTVVYGDAILNVPKIGGMAGIFLGPTGRVSVPRFGRMFLVKDKRAFVADVEDVAKRGAQRLMFAHGKPVDADVAGALRGVVEQMR